MIIPTISRQWLNPSYLCDLLSEKKISVRTTTTREMCLSFKRRNLDSIDMINFKKELYRRLILSSLAVRDPLDLLCLSVTP